MPENVNHYHITPLINDLARYFNKYRLVSVESKELGIKLEAKDLATFRRITAEELVKDFTCDNLAGIWTPKHQTWFEKIRISKLQTLGTTFFPMMSRQYFPISWGSWESFRLEGEKYPALEDAVEPNV